MTTKNCIYKRSNSYHYFLLIGMLCLATVGLISQFARFPNNFLNILHDVKNLPLCQAGICTDNVEIIDVWRFFPVYKRSVETVVCFRASRDVIRRRAFPFPVREDKREVLCMVIIVPDFIIENHSSEHLHGLRKILCEILGKSDEFPIIHHGKLDGFTKQACCRSYVESFAGWGDVKPPRS